MDIQDFEKLRWKGKKRCPYCRSLKYSPSHSINGWPNYNCTYCKKDFSVITKTPLSRTLLTPNQWNIILQNRTMIPSHLSILVGVHHWTASKIQTKIKDKKIEDLFPEDYYSVLLESFHGFIDDLKYIPIVDTIVAIAFLEDQEPVEYLTSITGLSEDFLIPIYDRITKYWPDKSTVFTEPDSNNKIPWLDPDVEYPSMMIALQLHVLLSNGELKRDPLTCKYSLFGGQ